MHTHHSRLLSPSLQDLVAVTWENTEGRRRKRYVITKDAIIEYREPSSDKVSQILDRINNPNNKKKFTGQTEQYNPEVQQVHVALTQLTSGYLSVPFEQADDAFSRLTTVNPILATKISLKIAQEVESLGEIIPRSDKSKLFKFFSKILSNTV